jgi:hypothetical protein
MEYLKIYGTIRYLSMTERANTSRIDISLRYLTNHHTQLTYEVDERLGKGAAFLSMAVFRPFDLSSLRSSTLPVTVEGSFIGAFACNSTLNP